MKKHVAAAILLIILVVVLAVCWQVTRTPEWPGTTAGTLPAVGVRTIYQEKTYECIYWNPGDRGAGATPAECNWWAEVQ